MCTRGSVNFLKLYAKLLRVSFSGQLPSNHEPKPTTFPPKRLRALDSGHTQSSLDLIARLTCSRTQAQENSGQGSRLSGDRSLTFVRGTMLSSSFWSTRLAPASERQPWLRTRQSRPKQQGQHSFCSHLVHLGLRCPYGSSFLGLKTAMIFYREKRKIGC